MKKAIRIEAKMFRLGVSHRDQWQQSGLVDLAQAYGLSYNDSQTTWLGDAVCTSHRNAEFPDAASWLGDLHPLHRTRAVRPGQQRCP